MNLMGSRFAHPAKWKFMAPYIQTLPDTYSLYGKYTFIQEHVAFLQDDKLVCHWPKSYTPMMHREQQRVTAQASCHIGISPPVSHGGLCLATGLLACFVAEQAL